ncbi:MAG: glucose-1-phosphate adenylyltransferase [Chloroflexota bacterium]
MFTRGVILAGGEGSRLGVLTAKRTKPAVPFAGKYRIIDFTLSNCVNSGIFNVMILAQYRPHSLIDHIGSGAPWDLNRDFTGGVRIYTPYKSRRDSDWYTGTADAVQQNFLFIKSPRPDLVLILSGDHIYKMNYDAMIAFHVDHHADLTVATIHVPLEEASRFGIIRVGEDYRITSFDEKPSRPQSDLANMGVYVFNFEVLNRVLLDDVTRQDSSHDFGKDILPCMVNCGDRVFAFPFNGYWVDVGTVSSYWQAHMDLLADPPSLDLNDRSWVVHTRTEERPPVRISRGAHIIDSMITDGCVIDSGAVIEHSVLAPGVWVQPGAKVREAIILTDAVIETDSLVERAVLDKCVRVGKNAHVGLADEKGRAAISMIGKNSILPQGIRILPGAVIDTDIIPTDFDSEVVPGDAYIYARRQAHEI